MPDGPPRFTPEHPYRLRPERPFVLCADQVRDLTRYAQAEGAHGEHGMLVVTFDNHGNLYCYPRHEDKKVVSRAA